MRVKVLELLVDVSAPGWVSYDSIEATSLHDRLEAILPAPIKNVNPVPLLVIDKQQLLMPIKIRANQRIAALNVVAQVWQGPLVKQSQSISERLFIFAFQNSKQERQFRDFDRLDINIHAIDIVQ